MNLGHWQFLTGFFRFSFVRMFIGWFALVPVVLYLFRSLPETVKIATAPDVVIELEFGLPFNWMILWLASFLFALAAALFAIFCPSFIRRHDTFKKYQELGHSPRWIVWEAHYVLDPSFRLWFWKYEHTKPMRDRFVEKKLANEFLGDHPIPENKNSAVIPEEDRTSLYFWHEEKVYKLYSRQAPDIDDRRENDIFWEVFGYLAKRNPCIRTVIKRLIFISFSLVLIVVIQNMWFAVEYFLIWAHEYMSTTQG